MSRWMTQVANFNKQKTRIEKQTAIAEKKAEKMDVFAPVAKKLIDVGGHPLLKRIGLTVDSLKLNFDSRKRNIIHWNYGNQ